MYNKLINSKFALMLSVLVVAGIWFANVEMATALNEEQSTSQAVVQTSRISGTPLAENLPSVSLDKKSGTVFLALQSICKQAKVGLIAGDLGTNGETPLTLNIKKNPFKETLELLLEAGDLVAEVKGSVIVLKLPEKKPAIQPVSEKIQSEITQPETPKDTPEGSPKIDSAEEVQIGPAGIEVKTAVEPTAGPSGRSNFKPRKRSGERVQFGKPMTIKSDEVVGKAVVIGESLTIGGYVEGDAVAVGGNVTILPGAVVEGDAVAVGGTLDVQEGSVLEGDRVSIGSPFGDKVKDMVSGMDATKVTGMAGGLAAFYFLHKALRLVVFFVIGILIVTFASRRHLRIREYLTTHFWKSSLTGLIIMVLIIPLCILLAVTFIGIPLIPILLVALLVFMAFGLTAFLTWLGDKVPFFTKRKNPIFSLMLGALILTVFGLIPVAGTVVLTICAFIGAGAAFLSRLGAQSKAPPTSTF